MSVLEEFRNHYRQRDLWARRWKEEGGKVVGYFCDNVPVEFILAAGLFPFRLSGDPRGGTEKVGFYSEEGNVFSREGFVASMLHDLLKGRYDFLDYLVIPHARDSVHRLYTTLIRRMETFPQTRLPELYHLDNLHTPFYSAERYNRHRWLDFKKRLEAWSGQRITRQRLAEAVALTNANKSLLKRVAAIRSADPPRLSGTEALQIIGTSFFMPPEEHNRLLERLLTEADRLPVRKGVRLFVAGSPLDNLQPYEIIESCGAVVVAEDNCWGNRSFDLPIEEQPEPEEAVLYRYHHKPPCPRMYPLERRVAYCLQSAWDARVRGAIFHVLEFDEIQAWETPDEIRALKEKGIPVLYLKNQPYRISRPEIMREEVTAFLRRISEGV